MTFQQRESIRHLSATLRKHQEMMCTESGTHSGFMTMSSTVSSGTYHAVAEAVDLTDSEFWTNEDHSFNVGILKLYWIILKDILTSNEYQ